MIIIIVAFIFMIDIIIIILLSDSFIQSYLLFYEHTDGRSNSPFRSLHRRSESPTRSMGSTTRKSESPIRYTSRSMYVNNNELKSSDSAKEKIDEERKSTEIRNMKYSTTNSLRDSGPSILSYRQNIINKRHSLGSNRGYYHYNNWFKNDENNNNNNNIIRSTIDNINNDNNNDIHDDAKNTTIDDNNNNRSNRDRNNENENGKLSIKENVKETIKSSTPQQSDSITPISIRIKSDIKNNAPVRTYNNYDNILSVSTPLPQSRPQSLSQSQTVSSSSAPRETSRPQSQTVSSSNAPRETSRPQTAPVQSSIKEKKTSNTHLKYSDLKYGRGIFSGVPHGSTGRNVLTPDNFITSSNVRKGKNQPAIFVSTLNLSHFSVFQEYFTIFAPQKK